MVKIFPWFKISNQFHFYFPLSQIYNNNNNNLILILRAFHEMIKRALHDKFFIYNNLIAETKENKNQTGLKNLKPKQNLNQSIYKNHQPLLLFRVCLFTLHNVIGVSNSMLRLSNLIQCLCIGLVSTKTCQVFSSLDS